MLGWLIVNGFLQGDKYNEIYDWLNKAFKKRGHIIKMYTNIEASLIDNIDVKPDFVLFWDKDITLAKRLESMNIRLFNNSKAIEICDNKALTYITLKDNIKMPNTYIVPMTYRNIGYNNTSFVSNIAKDIGYPLVIKECFGSFGEQVYLANDEFAAIDIIKNTAEPLIIQQFIAESKGRDIRINVVGDKVVASMIRKNEHDFRANITNGGSAASYEPTSLEIDMAVNVCKLIGLDFGGVDILFSNDAPILCEVNSNAHFKSIYDCTGVNVADEIVRYIEKCLVI